MTAWIRFCLFDPLVADVAIPSTALTKCKLTATRAIMMVITAEIEVHRSSAFDIGWFFVTRLGLRAINTGTHPEALVRRCLSGSLLWRAPVVLAPAQLCLGIRGRRRKYRRSFQVSNGAFSAWNSRSYPRSAMYGLRELSTCLKYDPRSCFTDGIPPPNPYRRSANATNRARLVCQWSGVELTVLRDSMVFMAENHSVQRLPW